MIIIACSVFNDLDSFKRHKSSIPKDPDLIHLVIDGRYKGFQYPNDLSNDGTREIAMDGSVLVDAPNLHQYEKRQIYFNMCDKNDILIPIDSDEYIQGNWDEFLQELELAKQLVIDEQPLVMCIMVYNPIHNAYDPRPRIFFNPHNVITGPHHFEFKSRLTNQSLIHSDLKLLKSIKLGHDYNYRYELRNKIKDEYYERTKHFR